MPEAPPEVRQCNNPEDPEFGSTAVAAAGAMAGEYAWFVGRPGTAASGLGGHWVPHGSREDVAIQTWSAGNFPAYTPPTPEEEPK